MDYAALRDKTVAPILQKLGEPVTLKKFADVFNSAIGQNVRTPTPYPTYAVIEDYRFTQKNGDLIRQGNKKLIMTSLVEPMLGDVVTIGGSDWSVVDVNAVAPAGIAVLYELQVRQ